MAAPPINHGRIDWGLKRNREGQRTYFVIHLVETENENAGPWTAFETPGLPLTGDYWDYGEDFDIWATCDPTATVRVSSRQPKEERGRFWEVTNTFTTVPRERCQDVTIEDPLLEPDRVSGGFSKQTKEAFFDRNGVPILSSSQEILFLPVDDNRPTVKIGQNVANLELDLFSGMIDTLNDAPLWGLPIRCVKLSNVSWSREYYGVCNVYYTRNLEFDVNFNTFDEELLDAGTRHLKPGEDSGDPKNFLQNKDLWDENLKGKMPLDGAGNVVDSVAAAATITPEYYDESNFLLLGIPTVL